MEIIKINQVDINFPQSDETIYVPVKPICEVLGISHPSQTEAIKNHPILTSVVSMIETTGADGKQYDMLCLPIKYVFGWLFSIDARKVKPEASEAVITWQEKVYDALHEKFYLEPLLQKKKLVLILEQENRIHTLKAERKELNNTIRLEEDKLEEIKLKPVSQLSLFPG